MAMHSNADRFTRDFKKVPEKPRLVEVRSLRAGFVVVQRSTIAW